MHACMGVSVGVGVCMHACMRAHVRNVSMHAWHGMPCASVYAAASKSLGGEQPFEPGRVARQKGKKGRLPDR